MDLLQGVQDAVEEASAPVENSEGSLDQLLKSLGEAEGVSDEAKEKLIQILKAKGGAEGMLTQDTMSSLGSQSFSVEMMMLLGLLSIIFLVLVFFGYKLYTSLSERERKKEEKRRQKQQKKKK